MTHTINAQTLLERVVGLTPRKLDCWCNEGIFRPQNIHPGSGHRRAFTDEDVLVAIVLGRLSVDLALLFGDMVGSWVLYREVAEQVRAGRPGIRFEFPHGLTLIIPVVIEESDPLVRVGSELVS